MFLVQINSLMWLFEILGLSILILITFDGLYTYFYYFILSMSILFNDFLSLFGFSFLCGYVKLFCTVSHLSRVRISSYDSSPFYLVRDNRQRVPFGTWVSFDQEATLFNIDSDKIIKFCEVQGIKYKQHSKHHIEVFSRKDYDKIVEHFSPYIG